MQSLAPVIGSVRLLCPLAYAKAVLPHGFGVPLTITVERRNGPHTSGYLLKAVREGGKVVGYTFDGETEVHAVDTSFGSGAEYSRCDCGDSTWRERQDGRGCKHRRSLAALLASMD